MKKPEEMTLEEQFEEINAYIEVFLDNEHPAILEAYRSCLDVMEEDEDSKFEGAAKAHVALTTVPATIKAWVDGEIPSVNPPTTPEAISLGVSMIKVQGLLESFTNAMIESAPDDLKGTS